MCITRAPEGEGVRQVRQEQARYGRVRQVRQGQAWSGRSDRSGRVRQEQARYSRVRQDHAESDRSGQLLEGHLAPDGGEPGGRVRG